MREVRHVAHDDDDTHAKGTSSASARPLTTRAPGSRDERSVNFLRPHAATLGSFLRMSAYERFLRGLALLATLPAGATFYFFVFWRWLSFWRRHRVLTYVMMLGTFVVIGVAAYMRRNLVLAYRIDMPSIVCAFGWLIVVVANLFGFVADRQIGLRVRSFQPFFVERGRITLETGGAYGVVRHPIYASGAWFQIGVFFISGYLAVAIAFAIFVLGALWFTRQEERRLMELLADPSQYERYRARVPALFPRLFRRAR
jgi:protein-S-isoprenylcysteine O-methyltransferase Ste14